MDMITAGLGILALAGGVAIGYGISRMLFERCIRVTLHYRTGAAVHFSCSSITQQENTDTGALANLIWDGARGLPFYFTLEGVHLIRVRRTWRRK